MSHLPCYYSNNSNDDDDDKILLGMSLSYSVSPV